MDSKNLKSSHRRCRRRTPWEDVGGERSATRGHQIAVLQKLGENSGLLFEFIKCFCAFPFSSSSSFLLPLLLLLPLIILLSLLLPLLLHSLSAASCSCSSPLHHNHLLSLGSARVFTSIYSFPAITGEHHAILDGSGSDRLKRPSLCARLSP